MGKKDKKARKNAANNKKRKLGVKPRNHRPCATPARVTEEWRKRQRKTVEKSRVAGLRRPQPFRDPSPAAEPPSSSSSGGDDQVQMLLEPYSKAQLIGFLCDAALADPALAGRIRAAADRDVSHRKIFAHGLPWDATSETLREVFSPFGPLDECNVVTDKVTGRCKGYGFVLFRTRSGAVEALAQPQKVVKGRVVHCQLASAGPVAHTNGATGLHSDTTGRKIYVSNVHHDTSPEKLKVFFTKFGEIETGPMGFDIVTGKSRGYAVFVYKTQEGARKALMEPYKMFEGHQLHCQWHDPAKVKDSGSGQPGAAPQPVLAAVAAAQNLSLYSHNPAYAALLAQNPLVAAASGVNPVVALTTPAAALTTPALGGGLVGYSGNPSLFGSYGLQGATGLQEMQFGQSLGWPGGSHGGMPSYPWSGQPEPASSANYASKGPFKTGGVLRKLEKC